MELIKVAELLVRKNGMSRAEFQNYWRRVHGPLVMSIPEIRRHVAKYVQSHTLPIGIHFWPAKARSMMESPKFGVTVSKRYGECSLSRSFRSW